MRRQPAVIVFFCLLVSMASSGCSSRGVVDAEQDKKAAIKEIQLLHERINSEQYGLIHDDACAFWRQSFNRESTIQVMKDTRQDIGKFVRITDKHSRIEVFTDRTPVEIRAAYTAEYEKGEVLELYTYIKEGRKVKLLLFKLHKLASEQETNPKQ